jgi:ABC-2 type transport system ATP-binding protein
VSFGKSEVFQVMLEVQKLTKRFHQFVAVDAVSFTLRPGEVTGYLGPNGSGKSTTIKMLTGLLKPSEGRILYQGQPITANPVEYRKLVGFVPEEPYLYPHLTGAEYLELVGQLRGLPERRLEEKIEQFLRLFALYGDRFSPLSSYSKGMKQKVLIAAALLHNPEIVVLDEPFSGLDVQSALVLKRLIQSLAEARKVVLYSSHVMEVVEKVCARVIILHQGRVVADDSVSRLREWMRLPSLEQIFSQLVIEQNVDQVAASLIEAMQL